MVNIFNEIDSAYESFLSEFDNFRKPKINSIPQDNKVIVDILDNFLKSHPYIKFGQALYILGILNQDANGNTIDIFNDEPGDILKRIKLTNV